MASGNDRQESTTMAGRNFSRRLSIGVSGRGGTASRSILRLCAGVQPVTGHGRRAVVASATLREEACSRWYNRWALTPRYSIVVPFHNQQESVTASYDRLKGVMEDVGEPFEMVFVDDGSSDGTFRMLEEIAAVDSRVAVVKLRRNFGPA